MPLFRRNQKNSESNNTQCFNSTRKLVSQKRLTSQPLSRLDLALSSRPQGGNLPIFSSVLHKNNKKDRHQENIKWKICCHNKIHVIRTISHKKITVFHSDVITSYYEQSMPLTYSIQKSVKTAGVCSTHNRKSISLLRRSCSSNYVF